jgi:hypothetical protein
VGAGKSTATCNFNNLYTYDEWVDERPPEIAVPVDDVDESRVPEIDAWIALQFFKKNYALLNKKEGIHLLDRSPLDPLTFTEVAHRPNRAKELLAAVTEGGSWEIEDGHVIFLECDPPEIRQRLSFKHKYWNTSKIRQLLDRNEEVYGNLTKSVVCTRGRQIAEVSREIAQIIFLNEYRPVSIQEQLKVVAAK